MARSKPYQPLLFRLSHGLAALFVIGCLITGYLVYESYDGRFGTFLLNREYRSLIDIHGTFGFVLFFIAIAFAYYSLRRGYRRLIQADSWQHLKQFGRPIWWYTLHRLANTLALAALALAVISGKFQDENWLPAGEVHHVWYNIHLISWAVMVVAIALHVLMAARVGGIPFLLSVVNTEIRPGDRPSLWRDNLRRWFQNPKF